MKRLPTTRLFLGLFVASILANAVLGIWALLSGDFGETQGKVLGTSFLVSAAMLSVLINIPGIRRRTLWPAPVVGGVAGALGFALFIAFLWAEPTDEDWFKVAGSCLVVAAGATLGSSLALLALPGRLRWLHPVADAFIAVLSVTVLAGLWFEPDAAWYARLLGVEGVLVAAVTLLVPVLSRYASRREEAGATTVPAAATAVRFCPSCGEPVDPQPFGAEAATVCETCGLHFTVAASPAAPSQAGGTAAQDRSAEALDHLAAEGRST